ncbi:hypothetical protein [Chryseobacterium sp.]|uniref:hypothetical protein n=1 Tax=Chryseobacterium sp. TaxID=1871047 RepID=UPI000EBA14BA|nr:hypothetical protein [Chryseobacterium sp.]HCM33003.1 hypothetical protein [Chryseobacterium sp.]
MKKIFYVLLGICLLSCSSSNDEVVEDTRDLQPDKAYEFYINAPYSSSTSVNNTHYQFTYENGNLKTVFRLTPLSWPIVSLLYQDNQIKVFNGDISSNAYALHIIENNRPIKSEYYNFSSELFKTKLYTYAENMIAIHEKEGNRDAYITYYFNSANNLFKQEILEQKNGLNLGIKTIIYSDYDKSKNPFKKLRLINDICFVKSLSANNFRKIESSYYDLASGATTQTEVYNCIYKYDSNGQVLLYHPL